MPDMEIFLPVEDANRVLVRDDCRVLQLSFDYLVCGAFSERLVDGGRELGKASRIWVL